MRIIKDQAIVNDNWCRPEKTDHGWPAGDIIIAFNDWLDERRVLLNRDGRLGVCIGGDDDVHQLVGDLAYFSLIALNFNIFTDGRCYSHARMLRDRYGFQGELRAVGDVMRDQLLFMQRCGINAFQLKDGKDLEDALNAFSELSVKYQAASDGTLPAYKYR